ncbi:hypothetical protein Droror1_Dr00005515 [Drosera rotundifolia]
MLVAEKNNELAAAQSEIKALRATENLKTRAVDELAGEIDKLDEKLRLTENILEQKKLEISKLKEEKKNALAAQYAAESTLRRVHASQKNDDPVPIEHLLVPLEAEIKMYKNEVASLLEDKKALERLNKAKEAALIETEKILRSALERALIVEEIQNENIELKKQVELCREEYRALEKCNRQKVLEVEKLTQTIWELEEALLAGGSAANVIRDYERQISELNLEMKTLERELARAKVSASRVATVVAKEWKDDNDKVMPVKQWLEDRKTLQAEIQRLKDKLAMAERTAKAEAQLKDKLKLRLKTLEDGLKNVSSPSPNPTTPYSSLKTPKSNQILGFLSNNASLRKIRSTPESRTTATALQKSSVESGVGDENKANRVMRRSLWVSKSRVAEGQVEEDDKVMKTKTYVSSSEPRNDNADNSSREGLFDNGNEDPEKEDVVSGFLYDRIQKEVIGLRKYCEDKDATLAAKNDEIKMLERKVDALTKTMQMELRKAKRENSAKAKESPTENHRNMTKDISLNSSEGSE